jgi:DNA-binding response OmpR family regulator
MPASLLVVEDDDTIRDTIREALILEGYEVTASGNGREALSLVQDAAERAPFSLVVLDLMLPGLDGLDLCRQIRQSENSIPILVVSARDSERDRVLGLEVGADDYLVKPFELKELHARIIANIRRNQQQEGPVLSYGPLRLELTTRRAFREGKELRLSPTEISLLELFIRHENQVLSRKMLYHQLWESDWESETNVIEVHINRLRSKVDRGFSRALIHTIRGRGYMLSENPPQGPRSAEDAVPESQDPIASHSA